MPLTHEQNLLRECARRLDKSPDPKDRELVKAILAVLPADREYIRKRDQLLRTCQDKNL